MLHLTPQSTQIHAALWACFLRIHISFGSEIVNAGAFLGALCESSLPLPSCSDNFIFWFDPHLTICPQSATSWPSLGGTSTSPGCPAATGRGFSTICSRPPARQWASCTWSPGTAAATSSTSTASGCRVEMNHDPASYISSMYMTQPANLTHFWSSQQCSFACLWTYHALQLSHWAIAGCPITDVP